MLDIEVQLCLLIYPQESCQYFITPLWNLSTCVLELIFRIELVGLALSVSVGLYYLFLCTAQ